MLKNLGHYTIANNRLTSVPNMNNINKRQAVMAGLESAVGADRQRRIATLANQGWDNGTVTGGFSSSSGFGSTGSNILGHYAKGVIDDFLNPEDLSTIRRIYKDIYYHDIAGCAVDLLSTLPWSDFSLTGLPEAEQFEVYIKSIDNISLKSLLPEFSVDFLVNGAMVSVLNFDANEKVFTGAMPQDINLCKITDLPIYGMDPIIDIQLPNPLIRLMNKAKTDKRLEEFMKSVPDFMQKHGKDGRVQLNPGNTLYVPRRTFSTNSIGTSYFRRILPIYILEKALLRGTIDIAYKRQRGINWMQIGDEDWEPTPEELTAYANMLIQADVDPVGAVLATRQGVSIQEIGQPGAFWRWDETVDVLNNVKLKMLGISDNLISGDASYNTLEVALSVFIENLSAYRNMFTRKVLTQKVFPALSIANGFEKIDKDRYMVTGSTPSYSRKQAYSDRIIKGANGQYIALCNDDSNNKVPSFEGFDVSDYYIPKVVWHKSLRPEADREYMEVLNTLQEKGVPIGLRQWAAAGGVSIHELLASMPDDLEVHESILKHNKKLAKLEAKYGDKLDKSAYGNPNAGGYGGGDDDDSGGGYTQSSVAALLNKGRIKRKGIFNRDYQQINDEIRDPDTKKRLSVKGRRLFNEKINKATAKALVNIADKENRKTKHSKTKPSKTFSGGGGVGSGGVGGKKNSIFGITD